jgi:hypothetical protein
MAVAIRCRASTGLLSGAPENPTALFAQLVSAMCLAVVCGAVAFPDSALASAECPNQALRADSNINAATGHPYSTELPDCRAYELVTSEKNDETPSGPTGGNLEALVSGDGASLLWQDAGGGSNYGTPSNGDADVRRVQRGPGAWSPPQTLSPERVNGSESFALKDATPDLATVLLEGHVINEINEYEYKGVGGIAYGGPSSLFEYRRGGATAKIVSGVTALAYAAREARLSADGNRVFFETEAQLLPEDHHGPIGQTPGVPGTTQLYEWTQSGGLQLAGVDSGGVATSPCGASLADGLAGGPSRNDVSADGSRVFFQSPDPFPLSGNPPEECRLGPVDPNNPNEKRYVSDLYVRENGSTTVDISRPPAGVPDYGARFVGASADGSKVFFVTETQLTPDKTTSGPGHADLYEYRLDTGALRRLSVGPPGYDDADLSGFARESLDKSTLVSADGSHVYFTALGQLVPGAGKTEQENIADCEGPTDPRCTANLYVYESGRVSFLATIGPATLTIEGNLRSTQNVAPLGSQDAAVTPTGSDLVFDSIRSLTAYGSEGHDELYRYDAARSTLSCVSCSPTGGPPEGIVYLRDSRPFARGVEVSEPPVEQVSGVSTDGSTVFFAATGQRLPAAVNSTNVDHNGAREEVSDVYEWRDGVLSLISSGTSASSDRLVGASPNGTDVFFQAYSQFVGQDGDHAPDIYDAHIGGGFASPAASVPCISLATCRSMFATPPVPLTPASVSVSSPGNLASVAEPEAPRTTAKRTTESRSKELARKLKACKKRYASRPSRRAACEAAVRKKYGARAGAMRSAPRRGRA